MHNSLWQRQVVNTSERTKNYSPQMRAERWFCRKIPQKPGMGARANCVGGSHGMVYQGSREGQGINASSRILRLNQFAVIVLSYCHILAAVCVAERALRMD